MKAASEGRWWLRWRANTRDESPLPEEFLNRLTVEVRATRRRNNKLRAARRRLAMKAPETES